MSHLFILKKKDGYHIDALFSESLGGEGYVAKYKCVHRRPLRDDGVYDFYDCHDIALGKNVDVSSVSFSPTLFQVVQEREEAGL